MIANKEKCANQDKSECAYNDIRRLRYFHGMLLDDEDFKAEQDYHVNKRRFLNRMLHGSGVVCGLDIKGKKEGRWIEVTSGLALDCSGNEIWVPDRKTIDLATVLPRKDKSNQLECEEDDAGPEKLTSYWICIRYDERPSNPVSVYLPSGSCEERACENSRYKEGYCIELLKDCPEKFDGKSIGGLLESFCKCETGLEFNKDYESMCHSCAGQDKVKECKCKELEKFCERSVPCPECCSCDKCCCVVLGKIEVDKECRLSSICINDCRRYVVTGRMLQHMVTSVFAGAEKYFHVNGKPVEGLNALEVARNPIEALCWYLRYRSVEGVEVSLNPCNVGRDEPDLRYEYKKLREEFDTERLERSKTSERLNYVIEKNKLATVPDVTVEKKADAKLKAALKDAVKATPTDSATSPEKPNTPAKTSKGGGGGS